MILDFSFLLCDHGQILSFTFKMGIIMVPNFMRLLGGQNELIWVSSAGDWFQDLCDAKILDA